MISKNLITVILISTIAACGGGGGGSSSAPEKPVVYPTVNLAIDKNKMWDDEYATLTWSTSNATSCKGVAGEKFIGNQPTQGSFVISNVNKGSHTYTLQCENSGVVAQKSVSINIDAVLLEFTYTIDKKSENANSLGTEQKNKRNVLDMFAFNTGIWGIYSAENYTLTQTGTVNARNKIATMENKWDVTSSATPGIVSFSNITIGKHPGWNFTTTDKFPSKISEMQNVSLYADVETKCITFCVYGTILDMFIMKHNNVTTNQEKGTEVIVALQYTYTDPNNFPDLIMLDSNLFKVRKTTYQNGWDVVILIPVNSQISTLNMNLKELLNQLSQMNYLNSNDYVYSVEIGTEVAYGKGETSIKNLSLK